MRGHINRVIAGIAAFAVLAGNKRSASYFRKVLSVLVAPLVLVSLTASESLAGPLMTTWLRCADA